MLKPDLSSKGVIMKKTVLVIAAIVSLLFCLCISAGVINASLRETMPTETPAPPTETPKPTTTATRVPSPTPPISAEDRAYRVEIAEKIDIYTTAWTNFQDQHDQLVEVPGLRFSDDWLAETVIALTVLRQAATDLSEVDGPEKYQQVEYWLDQLGPEVGTMIDNYVIGVDDWDAKYLSRASDNVERIGAIFTFAKKALDMVAGQD